MNKFFASLKELLHLGIKNKRVCFVLLPTFRNFAGMKEVLIKDEVLQQAAQKGMDAFVKAFVDAIYEAIGGVLNAETMPELNANQITLLAFDMLHEEVMDGGFVQLIHNGYGPFIFKNPFAKMLKVWGLAEFGKLVYKAYPLYVKYGAEIEKDCTDDEFMEMFERYPEFDDFDDTFVENEEEWTEGIAHYIDEHIDQFVKIV